MAPVKVESGGASWMVVAGRCKEVLGSMGKPIGTVCGSKEGGSFVFSDGRKVKIGRGEVFEPQEMIKLIGE